MALAVICKEPIPGRVKTRLTPPCTPEQAAALAEAALVDTFAAVAATPATRRVCILDGAPGPWLPDGFDVIPQSGGGLDERLAAAFEAIGEPCFLVGMDTPQLTSELLEHAVSRLQSPGVEGVLGLTHDGGYWGIGLQRSRPEFFVGVPMSQDDTGALQLARLLEHGLVVDPDLPMLTDVDTMVEADHVSALVPSSRFAVTLGAFRGTRASSSIHVNA